MASKRIVIAETIAESGLDRLRAAGYEVDVQLDKTPEEMHEILRGAQGLIVRSANNTEFAIPLRLGNAAKFCSAIRSQPGLPLASSWHN